MKREKNHKFAKIIAIVLFVFVFGTYTFVVCGYNKMFSNHNADPANIIAEITDNDIRIEGRGRVELTEDMLPEGRTLEDYNNPMYGMDKDVYDINEESVTDEEFLSQLSGIEGLTWGDIKEMGLITKENADTDHDGLTDKEEIETYKTNPKAKSTADDMFTDGYKVENGLDPLVAHTSDEEIVFPYNMCEETITLTAKNVDGINAVAKKVTGRDKLTNDVKIYAEYEVYNCNSKIKINLHSINKNLEPDDVKLLVGKNFDDKTEAVDFDIEGERDYVIIPKIIFDIDTHYYVFVVSADSMSKAKSMLNNIPGRDRVEALKEELAELEAQNNKKIAIIYGCPLLEAYSGPKMKMIIEEADEDINMKEREIIAKEHNDMFENDSVYVIPADSDDLIKSKTKAEMIAKKETLDKFFSKFAYNNYAEEMNADMKGNWYKLFFTYKCVVVDDPYAETPLIVSNADDEESFDGTESSEESAEDMANNIKYYEDEEAVKSHTGFDINSDEFPFENFGSYISKNGNCAGISWYATTMFNTKSVPTSNSFSHYNYTKVNGKAAVLAKDGEWNITNDTENTTLVDPGLVDYKDFNFTPNNTKNVAVPLYNITSEGVDMGSPAGQIEFEMMDYDHMTAGEQNFIDMIGDYHTQLNDINKKVPCAVKGETEYSWNTITNIMNRLDQGLVTIIAMTGFKDGSRNGHAMIIYDYEYQPSDPDNVKLWVYDSNYPMVKDFCFINVNKEISPISGQETFSYDYNPLPFLTSDVPAGQEYSFDAYDEGMNSVTEFL